MNKPLRILVVEDDEAIRFSVQEVLEVEGYEVESFPTGQLALERLKQTPESCLILLDLLMPDMNGWDFLKELQKLSATIVPIPVYLFSAARLPEGEVKEMKVRGFIRKPVNLDHLIGIVNDHCERRPSFLKKAA